MNKYLTSTLFAGLFATAAVFSPAMGQELPLEPQGAWAITKVDRSQQGGNSYCTLSRKYNDGIVLSLGRNQTEEYSIAIDFQKQVFEQDKSIKINLQPGPGQIRAYDMMPTSEKAVVVRLGWDTGFFDALNQSQQMKVKVADKGYSFAMPEIAKGQNELQACMEDLKTAAKGGNAADKTAQSKDVLNSGTVQASSGFSAGKIDTNTNSAGNINAQKQQVAAQEKEVLRNFAQSMEEQEDKSVKGRNFANPKPEASPEKLVVAQASVEKKEFVPEVVRRPQIADASGAETQKKVEELKAAQRRLDEITAENEHLKQTTGKVSVEAQKQAEALRAQNAMLQQKLAMIEQEKSKLPDPKILDAARAENDALKQKIASMEQANKKLEQDIVAARMAQVSPAAGSTQPSEEIAALKQKIASMEQDLLATQMAQIEPTAGKADSEKPVAALQKQIADLTAQNEALKKQSPAIAAPSPDAQKQVEAEKKALQDKIAMLEQQVSQKAKPDDIAKMKELEIKNTQLEDSLRQAQVRIGEAAVNTESKSLRKITELETKLSAAQNDNMKLAKQLDDARLTQENVSLASVAGDGDLEKATKRYNEAEREIRRLGQQIEQAGAVCETQKAEIEQMLFDPAVADQKQIDRLNELQAQLDEANYKLSAGGSTPVKSASSASMETATLKQQVADLQKQLAAKSHTMESSMTPMPVPAVTKVDPVVTKQLADLQVSMNKIRADNEALRNENISLKTESGKLQQQVLDAQSNGGARADRVASIQLQMEDMKREMAMKDSQNATYQNQLASLQQETTQLKKRLVSAPAPDENGEATKQIQSLQKQVSDMEKSKQEADRQYRERASQVTRYSNLQPAAGMTTSARAVAPAENRGAAAYDKDGVKGLLQKAGLSINGVQRASSGMPGAENYAWTDSSDVKGLASVKSTGDADFEASVNQYIAYQKSQCRGDFASMPSPTNGNAVKRMALYEMACVGGSQSLSSSMVFYQDGGKFIAISNQTGANDMDIAMDSRDKIASAIRGM